MNATHLIADANRDDYLSDQCRLRSLKKANRHLHTNFDINRLSIQSLQFELLSRSLSIMYFSINYQLTLNPLQSTSEAVAARKDFIKHRSIVRTSESRVSLATQRYRSSVLCQSTAARAEDAAQARFRRAA